MMSPGWTNWNYGPGTWVGGILMLALLMLVVFGIAALIKSLFGKERKEKTVLEYLNEQYAAGEITKEEFTAALEKLEQAPHHYETALDILKRRYALGNLTLEEFERMKTQILT
ncbi:MAG: SHOCT domain-containing protein [Candidatus Vecturithrix sp.]|jgi:uncharacterized membrane protein|nr:SHOCT domain-containing protein [Candidatus Vecturithrix sp.]